MPNSSLKEKIHAITATVPGETGVFVDTLDDQFQLCINADELYPTASSVKVFVLYSLLRGVDQLQISLTERVEYLAQFSIPGSGVITHLEPGLTPTLKDLATLMMMISDNTATNILIDYLGLAVINEAISSIPLEHSRIGSWSNFKESDRDSFSLGTSTPRELAGFLKMIRLGTLLSPQSTELFWDILRIQKYIEPLRKLLPASPWAREWGQPEPVWVASKCGHLIDCTTESGLIHAHGREWVISIMTKGMPNADEDPNDTGDQLISDISAAVYETLAPKI